MDYVESKTLGFKEIMTNMANMKKTINDDDIADDLEEIDITPITPLFYAKDYVPQNTPRNIRKRKDYSLMCDLHNPVSINEYFKHYIYKQDDYIKNLSMFLYNHIENRPSIMIVSGPPGNGKTYAAEIMRNIYSDTLLWDASTITQNGWKGNNKINDCLRIASKMNHPIIVLDEFDKMCRARGTSNNDNIGVDIQAEFLRMFEGANMLVNNSENDKYLVNTTDYSWLLLGSFSEKANKIADTKSSSGMGFEQTANDYAPYTEKLDISDLIEYGILPEIASRITTICNTTPLTKEDFIYLLTKHENSPIKEIEEIYDIKLGLKKKDIEKIANECLTSGLGIRNITSKLRNIANDMIYEKFVTGELPKKNPKLANTKAKTKLNNKTKNRCKEIKELIQ